MATITSLRIETWGVKFVVVGEFRNHSEIPRREFDSYYEALKALSKIIGREELRNETSSSRHPDW